MRGVSINSHRIRGSRRRRKTANFKIVNKKGKWVKCAEIRCCWSLKRRVARGCCVYCVIPGTPRRRRRRETKCEIWDSAFLLLVVVDDSTASLFTRCTLPLFFLGTMDPPQLFKSPFALASFNEAFSWQGLNNLFFNFFQCQYWGSTEKGMVPRCYTRIGIRPREKCFSRGPKQSLTTPDPSISGYFYFLRRLKGSDFQGFQRALLLKILKVVVIEPSPDLRVTSGEFPL